MNWDELTMAQKNELMKTYIRNGVTSLDDMRSHFNSFALGGDKDNPDNPPISKIPTRNEYLAQRAAEEQQKYFLEGSRNRKESYELKSALNTEDIEHLQNIIQMGDKEINGLIEGLSKNAQIPKAEARHYLTKHQYPVEWQGEFDYFFNVYNDIEKQQTNAKKALEENIKYLANCIATATSNHPYPGHFVMGNQTFSANPREYGHVEVPEEESKDGGLVQFLNEQGIGTHMAIRDHVDEKGNLYLNYGPGDYPSYKTNEKDWEPEGKKRFYNFVGNHQDSVRWNNEYDQLYGNHKLGGYLFATGGPKDPPTVLPVNEEGFPYYTLPDLEVTAERLPQAKVTDTNIQRYANAVASGQLKLTQIPNTELRNRVRAKPIVDQIMRDRDKTLAPILMGTVGMPAAIIGGISAAPTVAAIMNNPIVDAGLTIHGAVTAPKNIKEGVQELQEGNYGRGALDLGLTALDLYGAGRLYKHGENAARRLAEVFTRQGDHLHTMNVQEAKKLLTKKETLDYVMKGSKHPELAYRTGEYSGNTMPGNGDWSHEGDVVDAFFGKPRSKEEYVRELSIEDLSPEMQKYIRENYGRKAKRIKVFDLGDVKDAASINDRDSWGLYKEIELPGQEEVKALGLKPDVDTKYVLDPGGYHHVRNEVVGDRMIHHNEDIWKYKASDYKKRRRNIFEEPNKFNVLAKDLGLRFIDAMGTPVVHTWTVSTSANHPQLFSDIIKQMKLGEENIKVNQDLLKNWYNTHGN